MEKMDQENSGCSVPVRSSSASKSFSLTGALDLPTTRVFRQLRVQAEDLALELVVRLRVLAKGLAAACPGHGGKPGVPATDARIYRGLRRQLDDFFASLEDRDFAGHDYFHHIRRFLQDSLPWEPGACGGNETCRIELLEAVITLLTTASGGEEAGEPEPAAALTAGR